MNRRCTPPPADNDDTPANVNSPVLGEDAEALIDALLARAVLDALLAQAVPILRAHLRRTFAARLPYLCRPRRRTRVGMRPGDDAPVDEVMRARARAILNAPGRSRR